MPLPAALSALLDTSCLLKYLQAAKHGDPQSLHVRRLILEAQPMRNFRVNLLRYYKLLAGSGQLFLAPVTSLWEWLLTKGPFMLKTALIDKIIYRQ